MTAVPATRTFVAGEVVLASYFNTNIRDVLNFLVAPPIFELDQATGQTLTTAVAAAVTFTNEVVDNSGMHSTSSNTSRATAVYPGYYQYWGGTGFAANATNQRLNWFKKNGTDINGTLIEVNTTTGGAVCCIGTRTRTTFLNVGDYLELFAFQNSGGNLGTIGGTDFSICSFGGRWASN